MYTYRFDVCNKPIKNAVTYLYITYPLKQASWYLEYLSR